MIWDAVTLIWRHDTVLTHCDLYQRCSIGIQLVAILSEVLTIQSAHVACMRRLHFQHIGAETNLLPFSRNKNVWISLKISPKVVPEVRINSIPAFVQIMAWCRLGDKPLSEPMMVNHYATSPRRQIVENCDITFERFRVAKWSRYRDHSGFELSQWEKALRCNTFTHWPSPYSE